MDLSLIDLIIIAMVREADSAGIRRPKMLALSYATGLSEWHITRALKRLIADGAITALVKKPKRQRFSTLEAMKQRDAKIRRDLVKQRADQVRHKGFTRPSITACRDIDPLATMLRRVAAHQRKTV